MNQNLRFSTDMLSRSIRIGCAADTSLWRHRWLRPRGCGGLHGTALVKGVQDVEISRIDSER